MSKNSDGNQKTICEKLDKLAIEILQTLQDLLCEKSEIEERMKDGFIAMAKARYLMRGRQVSKLQIDNENLIASTKVITTQETIADVPFNSFDLQVQDMSKADNTTENSELRNRKKEDLDEDFDNMTLNSVKNKETDELPCSDPLKWFGVLVPESLRISQSRFQQAIQSAVRIATLQSKLNAFHCEYKSLLSQKNLQSS